MTSSFWICILQDYPEVVWSDSFGVDLGASQRCSSFLDITIFWFVQYADYFAGFHWDNGDPTISAMWRFIFVEEFSRFMSAEHPHIAVPYNHISRKTMTYGSLLFFSKRLLKGQKVHRKHIISVLYVCWRMLLHVSRSCSMMLRYLVLVLRVLFRHLA